MDKTIEAVNQLLTLLFDRLGPGWTLLYLIVAVALAAGLRWYVDRRKDRYVNLALEEKEKALQRAASEAREWRVYFGVTEVGMDQRLAERIFQRNEFLTPAESRRALERPRSVVRSQDRSAKPKGSGRRKRRRK